MGAASEKGVPGPWASLPALAQTPGSQHPGKLMFTHGLWPRLG